MLFGPTPAAGSSCSPLDVVAQNRPIWLPAPGKAGPSSGSLPPVGSKVDLDLLSERTAESQRMQSLSTVFDHTKRNRPMRVRKLSDDIVTDELERLSSARFESSKAQLPSIESLPQAVPLRSATASNASNTSRVTDAGHATDASGMAAAELASAPAPSAPEPGAPTSLAQIADAVESLPPGRVMTWSDFDAAGRKFLGDGEFANAYSSTLDGAPVALKVLKPSRVGSQSAVRGLKREIMLLSLMDHPGIMHIVALGQHDNQPFMVMPCLANVLAAALPRDESSVSIWTRRRDVRAWPLSRAVEYGRQLADALSYCHEGFPGYRVLHRDIKPKNIGLTAEGRLMLFDFGLASIWQLSTAEEEAGCDDVRGLTGETGSLRYMAPEVANYQPYNCKADIFSFASVLFEMCAHVKPFADLLESRFRDAISRGVRPHIREAWPAELRQLFSQCWEASPALRPRALECAQTLEALATTLGAERHAEAPPAKQRWGFLFAALGRRKRRESATA